MSENWYKTAKIAEELYRDASLKENLIEWLPAGLLSALLAVMAGFLTVGAAAKSNNVSEQQLRDALNNKDLVAKVQAITEKEMQEIKYKPLMEPKEPKKTNLIKQKPKTTPKPHTNKNVQQAEMSLDKVINAILQHEGLKQGQTPFRITHPSMRKWNNILGFPIDKNPNAPVNRQNFLYLENPSHVPLAVKKQFENYAANPSHYGLGPNPSLEDALRKFDQTNVNSKISFLKARLPGLDTNQPLKNFLR